MRTNRTLSPCAPLQRLSRCALAVSLAVTLGATAAVALPSASVAAESDEISAELDAARAQLDELTRELEIAQATVHATEAELADTQDRIAELETQIAETTEQLATARSQLSGYMADSYKNGGSLSLADMILSSRSFEELVSNVYYANKVVDSETEQIGVVVNLQSELESQQAELSTQEAELQTLLDQQVAQAQDLATTQASTQQYIDGLSVELQEALEAERAAAAEEARRQAEEAAAAAAAEAEREQQNASQNNGGSATGGSSSNNSNTGGSSNTGSSNTGGTTGGGSSTGGSTGGSVSSGSLSASQRSTIVSAATSQLGVSYVLGASTPGVAMDCSGLSSYAYGQAGVYIPHQSGAQYRLVVAAGNLKTDASQLSAGDLVFYQSGGVIYHVAVYIGGGQVCHANGYGSGVVITSVFLDSGFCGGGSPV